MELSECLKQHRRAKGFTHKQVADYLGLERSTYTNYELGKTEPRLNVLLKLCELYDVSVGEVLQGNASELDIQIYAMLRGLSDSRKKSLIEYMRSY